MGLGYHGWGDDDSENDFVANARTILNERDDLRNDLAKAKNHINELKVSLDEILCWTVAALECETWHWDGDHREAAGISVKNARKVLGK